jgi:hypothetical protein
MYIMQCLYRGPNQRGNIAVQKEEKGLICVYHIDRFDRFTVSINYKDVLREDLCAMFLGGASIRTLSSMSERLIGRKLSAGRVSAASKEPTQGVEA